MYLLHVCIFAKDPLVFHGNYVLNIMSSELANSSDVHASPSEPDSERKPGEPFKGLELAQVSPNLKQNAESSWIFLQLHNGFYNESFFFLM